MKTAAEVVAETEARLDGQLPPGWSKAFVMPPWRGQVPHCRSCGADPTSEHARNGWADPLTITRRDEATRTLFYSFALACPRCANDARSRDFIARQVFEPNGVPPVPAILRP